MTIGSLFSGIGGLELGLESIGLGPVIWQCDSDPHARAVLATHWPSVHRYDDVREIDESCVRPDIICGGFPCQDISVAGKRAGIDGERSGLWSEFARIVRVLRPSIVFVENVSALVNRGLDRVLGDLADIGLDAEWETFRASDVGAPHRRDRIFILAYSRRIGINRIQSVSEQGRSDSPCTCWPCSGMAYADGQGRQGLRSGESSEPRRIVAAERGSEHVADANCDGRIAWPGTEAGDQERDEPGDVGPVADANCDGRQRLGLGGIPEVGDAQPRHDADRRNGAHRFPPGPAAIAGWDGPQPAIRKCHDGSARGLDGAIDGSNSQRGPVEELRSLRESVSEGSLQRRTGRRVPLSEAQLLFEGVLGTRTSQGHAITFSDAETNRQDEEAVLREVRRAVQSQQPPQGSELAQQRTIELGNALLILSYLIAPRCWGDPSVNVSAAVFCLWKAIVSARSLRDAPHSLQAVWRPESNEEAARWIVGACLGYLGIGRSHRLRLLGNSVVQQQAALAFVTLARRVAIGAGGSGGNLVTEMETNHA